jgi:hypothetical protein
MALMEHMVPGQNRINEINLYYNIENNTGLAIVVILQYVEIIM